MVVGINGTGKTTFMREIAKQQQRTLIVTPDSAEWRDVAEITNPNQLRTFSGTRRMIYDSDTLEIIKQNYFGGALILDDAMAYLNEQTPEVLQYIYIRRRQFGIDIYIVAHGLRQLPPKCFTFGSFLVLFNTTENFQSRKKELLPELYEKIIDAQARIRKKVISGNPYYHEIILLDSQIRGIYEQQHQ